jgi:hypothetical protein
VSVSSGFRRRGDGVQWIQEEGDGVQWIQEEGDGVQWIQEEGDGVQWNTMQEEREGLNGIPIRRKVRVFMWYTI